jgi:hypothetical protein
VWGVCWCEQCLSSPRDHIPCWRCAHGAKAMPVSWPYMQQKHRPAETVPLEIDSWGWATERVKCFERCTISSVAAPSYPWNVARVGKTLNCGVKQHPLACTNGLIGCSRPVIDTSPLYMYVYIIYIRTCIQRGWMNVWQGTQTVRRWADPFIEGFLSVHAHWKGDSSDAAIAEGSSKIRLFIYSRGKTVRRRRRRRRRRRPLGIF